MSLKELSFDSSDEEGTEGKEVAVSDQKLKFNYDSWTNEKLDPVRLPLKCMIPNDILITMRTVERMMINSGMGALEFGVFLKGKLNSDGVLIVENEVYVPKQKVTGVTIDFEEQPPEGFNGVIHRHPDGCKSFSGVDYAYINKNFEFSLLYVCNEITMGIMNFPYLQQRIQLPINPSIIYPVFSGFENVLDKIEKQERGSSIGDNDFFGRKQIGGHVPGLSIEDRDDNDDMPLFAKDEEDEFDKMYQCKHCGETQEISEFPHECEGCERMLDQTEVSVIDDLESEIGSNEIEE